MEPSLPIQAAIRSRLTGSSAVTALVPASSIIDRNAGPEGLPAIIIGEGQTVPDSGLARTRHQVYLDLHVWAHEPGLAQAKVIAGAIRAALSDGKLTATGLNVADLQIRMSRFMRDPGGVASHGVLNLLALVEETS